MAKTTASNQQLWTLSLFWPAILTCALRTPQIVIGAGGSCLLTTAGCDSTKPDQDQGSTSEALITTRIEIPIGCFSSGFTRRPEIVATVGSNRFVPLTRLPHKTRAWGRLCTVRTSDFSGFQEFPGPKGHCSDEIVTDSS